MCLRKSEEKAWSVSSQQLSSRGRKRQKITQPAFASQLWVGKKKPLKGALRSSPGGTERERTRTASWVRPPSHSSSWDFTGILARPFKQPWSGILMLSPANKDVRASKGSVGASWEWKKSPERWGGWVSGGGTAARDDPGTFPALPALPFPPEPQD